MIYTNDHGGACCGISHVYNFGPAPTPQLIQELDRKVEWWARLEDGDRNHWSHLYEAVLTDSQMMGWAPELKKRGFKLVTRFYNSNSGNYCNVLHYAPYGPRGRNRVKTPYKW